MNLFNILLTYRKTWLGDIPRSLFSSIDSAVYQMISSVYGLIEDLAHVQIFKEGVIQNFYNKTYALLAIFMVFKLTFSIVSYVLDPAKVTDKSAGFGKIITNVMIMFVMILSAPVVFKNLYKLQEMILDEGVIYNFLFQQGDQEINADGEKKLIIGDPEACKNWRENPDYYGSRSELINSEVGSWYVANNGDYISLMLYRNFFNLGTLNDGQNLGYRTGDDADNSYQYLCNGKDITVHGYSDITDLIDMINDTVNRSGKNDYYVIDYKYVVGTAVGVFVLLELISIAFDVAVRAIKLGFLQLIAPIPIMSYIDPKSGKNGLFSNWIKEVGKTWISLFTRLFAVFFAVFIISSIDYAMVESINTDNYTMQSKSFFIIMFVIIGALMFAKQLPQLLEQLIPGMKMGKMQLNPFKKIADEALGGKALLGGAAALGAAGLGMATNVGSRLADENTWKMRNKNGKLTFGSVMKGLGGGLARSVTSGIAGAGSSAFRAGRMTAKDGKIGKGMWTGYQESNKARFDRDDNLRKAGVVTAEDKLRYFMGSLGADAARLTGNLTKGQRDQIRLQEMKSTLEKSKYNLEQRKNAAIEPVKSYNSYMDAIKNAVDNASEVRQAKEKLEMAKNGVLKDKKGRPANVSEYKKLLENAENKAYSQFMSTSYGEQLRSLAIDSTNSMNLSDEEKSAYSNFDNYSIFKKNKKDSSVLESSRSLDFVNDEQNIKAQEAAIHEFENSSDYKMGQATNNDRRSTGTLKAGQQVNPNVGNVMDNPYYDPGYYGNNGGPGRPPRGGNGGGPKGDGRP